MRHRSTIMESKHPKIEPKYHKVASIYPNVEPNMKQLPNHILHYFVFTSLRYLSFPAYSTLLTINYYSIVLYKYLMYILIYITVYFNSLWCCSGKGSIMSCI